MAYREGGGETGRMYEAKFMGKPTVGPEFLLEVDKLPRLRRDQYKEAVFDLYKKHYEDDPTDPPGEHLKELRLATIEALGLNEDEGEELKAYTAVGTPLDLKFGTDGFIEFTDPKSGMTGRVTLDTTLNRRKIDESEPEEDHLVLGEMPDAVQDDAAYLEAMESLGAKIATRLMKSTNPHDQRKAA